MEVVTIKGWRQVSEKRWVKAAEGFVDNDLGQPYVRLTFKQALVGGGSKTRTVWAVKTGNGSYRVVGKDGESTNQVVVIGAADLVREQPAHMSNKYGELEVK